MDFAQVKENALVLFKRYRFFLLVLTLGIGLMLLPAKSPQQAASASVSTEAAANDSLQEELSLLLSGLSGAGKVQVLLTHKQGEEILYQCNENINASDASQSTSTQTVTITDSTRTQAGLVRRVNPPVYLGAVVLCQGADSAAVRLAIVEAVSNATGLPTHKISVLKMK